VSTKKILIIVLIAAVGLYLYQKYGTPVGTVGSGVGIGGTVPPGGGRAVAEK
jgi:hypothetical protein